MRCSRKKAGSGLRKKKSGRSERISRRRQINVVIVYIGLILLRVIRVERVLLSRVPSTATEDNQGILLELPGLPLEISAVSQSEYDQELPETIFAEEDQQK